MRTVSGRRNRVALLLAGVLFIATGLWLGAPATPLRDRWEAAQSFVPAPETTFSGLVAGSAQWLTPAALGVAVLLCISGALLLLAQIPTPPPHSTLRITDEDETVLGSVPPEVVERAMADALEGIAGVSSASVRVGGGSEAPWVQASATVSERAETSWVAHEARARLASDVKTVLGVEPRSIDLLIGLESAAKRTGGQVTQG